MRAHHAPALFLCALAGCALEPRAAAIRHDPLAPRLIALAASRIQLCYRPPRLGHAARQIETVLGVRYAPDGNLAELPELIAQRGVTDENRADAARMADAARLAVISCAPLALPADHYQNGWDRFELTFSPKAVA